LNPKLFPSKESNHVSCQHNGFSYSFLFFILQQISISSILIFTDMFELLHDTIQRTVEIKEDEFLAFTKYFTYKKIEKREFFLTEGEICFHQAFVKKGILRSYTLDNNGNEIILQFASERWWVADLSSYINHEPSFLNIEALEDSELLLLTRPAWEEAMKEIPILERFYRLIIQNHLISTQKRLVHSLSETAEEKYLRFLETFPDSVQRVPQHMIASYLGIARETLSRVRGQLASR